MQGSVSPEHVQAYFDEWVFRFNRRHSRSRGLLFHALLQNFTPATPSPTGRYARLDAPAHLRRHRKDHEPHHPAWTSDDPNCPGASAQPP